MPTLADIYSALNTFKRKSSDFVQNPGTSLEQMLFAANENAREFNKKHALATDYTIAQARGQQPTPEQTQAEMGLRNTLSEAYSPGMTVWHGSPHVFERFDLRKIGTGEGAQAMGYGHYLAERPETARIYSADRAYVGATMQGKPTTVNFDDPVWLAQKTIDEFGDAAKAKAHLEMVARTAGKYQSAETKAQLKDAIDLVASNKVSPKGSIYKVDLPDEVVPRMLDYDKPINEQSPYVIEALRRAGINEMSSALAGPMAQGQEAHLAKFGIPGIKYLDEASRKKNTGTRNFVVFPGNEGLLNILGRE